MRFLKGLAFGFLGLLLFLSLSVFGLALTLNYTILSPDFVISELNKLDVSSLVEELTDGTTTQDRLPEEFRVTLVDAVAKLEPSLKEQVGAAIYPIYDYLRGKNQSLDLALVLGDTVLHPDFVASVVNELDISSLASAFLVEQITAEIPEEISSLIEKDMAEYVEEVIAEQEPWVKEQVNIAIEPTLDYLLGKSQSLRVVISLEPLRESLEDTLREDFLESLPPELAGLLPAQVEQYLDEFIGGMLAEVIPSTFEINETMLGAELPAQIAEALAEGEAALAQAKPYVGYFQLGYNVLMGFILLLILGIILISREVKGITRKLGSIFLTYGIFEYAGVFVIKYFAGPQISQLASAGIPTSLQVWLPQLFNNFLVPLQMFSLGLIVAGVVLVTVSFVYKPRQPAD